MPLPRISIVTTCLNAEAYLEDTLRSVLDQGYPNLEYIVLDGGSKDRSPEIIRAYSGRITRVFYESGGKGFYESLNKGFSVATGDVLGWLNSDDLLHRKALFTVGEVFASFPGVEWITGVPTNIDVNGRFFESRLRSWWDARALLDFRNGNPQQESTFWRKSLWDWAGACLDTRYRYAADYDLWCRFMAEADLVSVRAYIGGFRKHDHNMSTLFGERYCEEREIIRNAQLSNLKGKMRHSRWKALLHRQTHPCIWYDYRAGCFKVGKRSVRSFV